MQVIVFTKETGELVLHPGPHTLSYNHILNLEGITSVKFNGRFYEACAGDEVKLRVPTNKTNVVYK
jgi:hypothetical protein